MRKIAVAFGFVLLVLASCSGDDPISQISPFAGTRLAKATVTGGFNYSSDYSYAGLNLNTILGSDGYKQVYHYTGSLISSIDAFDNTVLNARGFFSYDEAGRLTEAKTLSYTTNKGYKAVLQYDTDGNVNISYFEGDFNVQDTPNSQGYTVNLYFSDDQIIKMEKMTLANGVLNTDTYTYTYDNNNNPHKMMPGYYKSQLPVRYSDGGIPENEHNLLSITATSSQNSQTVVETYNYTYNALGYPLTSVISRNGVVSDITRNFIYE